MKTLSFTIMVVCIISCRSQGISSAKVPSVVLNTLQMKYQSSTDVDWKRNENMYEAELDLNDSTEIAVLIDANGKLVMEKTDVPLSSLSSACQTILSTEYKDKEVEDVERVIREGRTYYQVELEGKGKDVHLVFTDQGLVTDKIMYWN